MLDKRALLALLIAGGTVGSAVAGPVADKSAEAERHLSHDDPLAAIGALDGAIEHIWAQMPLTIRKALLVDGASGFGIYAAREQPVYEAGEVILVYAEPAGFAYGRDALGGLQIAFDIDLTLTDASGEAVLVREDFIAVETGVRYRNREFQLTLRLNLSGAPPGSYVANFLVRDRHSPKSASFAVQFEIAGSDRG